MKGCLGDSREGDNSGQTQSDLDARFLPLSLSISMRRKVIACSGSCEAIVYTWVSMIKGPRTLVDNIQKLISATPRGSKVKGMPQDHSQSPQTTKISRANLSPSLSNSTMFHVLQSIFCPLLSSPSIASTTHCHLKPRYSRLGDNTESWFSN